MNEFMGFQCGIKNTANIVPNSTTTAHLHGSYNVSKGVTSCSSSSSLNFYEKFNNKQISDIFDASGTFSLHCDYQISRGFYAGSATANTLYPFPTRNFIC